MPRSTVRQQKDARQLIANGASDRDVADAVGLARTTICNWRNKGFPTLSAGSSPLPHDWRPPDCPAYAYLLGMNLGDGCVVEHARTRALIISLDGSYPSIVDECYAAIAATAPVNISRVVRQGGRGLRLVSYWRAWPVVFPQHGSGKKHLRRIVLEPWQREILDLHPRRFLRGLIHSDGSRVLNRFSVRLESGPREYVYTRYFFTNLSVDIRDLFCEYCERLTVRCTQSSYRNISIADRRSVAILDSFVGPKT